MATRVRRSPRKPAGKTARSGAQRVIASGPSKTRKPGPPPPRNNKHKPRSGWFRARVTWPLREASGARLIAVRTSAARKLSSVTKASPWELAGPTNIGGRCTALVCHPAEPGRIWIGAAGGGVWASTDAGITWQEQWRDKTVLQIGALAIDPSNPAVLYCGTGEANLSADSYSGDGIYRSTNGGKQWKQWAMCDQTGLPRRIGVIAVDPFDRKHLLVGGIGYGRLAQDNDFGGLYTTANGGKTWQRATFISTFNYWCHSIVFDPLTRGTIYATFTEPGAKNGIYRSLDGGASWIQLTTGLPASDRMGRTTLALAPSNPQIVYAIAAELASSRADNVLGVFRSANGGNTWINIAGQHFRNEGQMSYGSAIAVHPLNPNHVICGGVDLHVTTNAGGMWRLASRWDADRGAADYAHADHHALVMPPGAPGRVYSVNDGGLDVSENGGTVWTNRSNGLAVTMYYDIDVAPTDARVVGGGAQDNGTLVTNTGRVDDAYELLGGDGGWMVVDPREAGHIYASYQYGGMYRFRNGTYRNVSPPFKPADMGGVWMVFITFDPNDSNTVYTGNQRLYRTRNDGVSWDALTPALDGSPISAIEVASANPQHILVGTENGGFFRSLDGGSTWSANLANSTLPSIMITRIETHPTNAREVYVTVANCGSSHVFRSPDSGTTWMDIDRGRLPDVPHHAILVRPDAPKTIYVCNDAGVYVSRNAGTTWLNSTLKLPNVMVVDIVYHLATKTLYAATYGRSLWKMRVT